MAVEQFGFDLSVNACAAPGMRGQYGNPLRRRATAKDVKAIVSVIGKPMQSITARQSSESLLADQSLQPCYLSKDEGQAGDELILVCLFQTPSQPRSS
jgi:hypothetical protein